MGVNTRTSVRWGVGAAFLAFTGFLRSLSEWIVVMCSLCVRYVPADPTSLHHGNSPGEQASRRIERPFGATGAN
jgi:hypothetical protein